MNLKTLKTEMIAEAIVELMAEREKMRAALGKISELGLSDEEWLSQDSAGVEAVKIAREALGLPYDI